MTFWPRPLLYYAVLLGCCLQCAFGGDGDLMLSGGQACVGGTGMNGLWIYQGDLKDGKAYFKRKASGVSYSNWYLYYDADSAPEGR